MSLLAGAIVPCFQNYAFAQSVIVPDETLGAESSQVIQNFNGQPTEVITNGARRGQNLFQSFREFNISVGRNALFFNPSAEIKNILARVTGNNFSDIAGGLGAFEIIGNNFAPTTANLFLINPNGIIFGAGARLDVGGSFVATTANAIQFGDRGIFSASTPGMPSTLLTVNPSAFFFNTLQSQPIVLKSQPAQNQFASLQVPDSQSLVLLGGDITLDGGRILAQAGRVELGGLAAPGIVELNGSSRDLSLTFPNAVIRSNVLLTNQAFVSATNDGGIAINAEHLDVVGNSGIGAFKIEGFGTPTGQAGEITLNVAQSIVVANSTIGSNTESNAGSILGNGSNILIQAGSLALLNGAQISAATFGKGNAGSINALISGNVTLDGVNSNGSGGIFSNVSTGGVGRGGNLNLNIGGSLAVTNGAQISAATFGQGDAGNISAFIAGDVALDGVNSNGFGGIFNSVGTGGVGRGGNLNLNIGGSLAVTNGAQISAATLGQGNAGDISAFIAGNVTLSGVSSNGFASRISSAVGSGGIGEGGNIFLLAGRRFLVVDGAQVSTATFGKGDAGNLEIFARDSQELIGTSPDGQISSGFSSEVGPGARGNGGNLIFRAGRLEVREGATISTRTFGIGNAGNLTIEGLSVSFDGQSASGLSSGAFSDVFRARGNGGALDITANSLFVTNGAQVSAAVRTLGQGTGGNIQIQASDSVNLSGVGANGFSSGLFTDTGLGAVGSAGEITVTAGAFRLADGAIVTAQTANSSDAGSVRINAKNFESINGGQILTTTSGAGNAGSILLNIANTITLSGRDPTFAARFAQFDNNPLAESVGKAVVNAGDASGLFASTTPNSTGNGGGIVINPARLTIENGAVVSVNSLGKGDAGNITAVANTIVLDRGKLTAESTAGRGGNIQLIAKNILFLRHNSLISAISGNAGTNGVDGSIDIDASVIVAIPSENSDIVATGFGRSVGSNVQIRSRFPLGLQFRKQLTPESDIIATGTFTFIGPNFELLNSLTDFPQILTDTTQLLANSCIVRRGSQNGSFTITGSGGLPQRPGDAPVSPFPTGEVRTVETDAVTDATNQLLPPSVSSAAHPLPRPWKIGDPIVEPQGVYTLTNGELVMSRECP
ncbi:MAG: filamentous hemagglutinin N-terminal domain-containing protein [Lyngbya sp. HA4199-MV5]|nr:filamentous hemagglutinin N-terminal domain-containing protein [Lyngbya sp. HA4199-MV5]